MIRTVLFDLDGTIMDTNELIIETFQHVLRDIVPQPFTREHIIPTMGMTLEEQLRGFSKREDIEDLVQAYRDYNWKRHDDLISPFPHVQEVIQRLVEANIQVGIVTTKIRLTTERALRMFDLFDKMGAVITFDDITNAKPHPEPVLRAVEMLGADPQATLMVGDSPADIQSANAAGVISCGVAWSLKGEALLKDYGAKHVLHDMRDLYALVGLERREGETT
ncbi:pyrophosphatase PpaX [Paenibacillus aquistagni]|uniref:Pyrophosphatase PpaX n=1 Tax=Paenibacillus aquistagni TaxID=1852522 RepID=A0A1X7L3N1_9BACL|nr:pyrophosphatase PpaX [Paenibacillus aquistagni]NMM54698.1 pyrophosphatase PpaX [Paenibacillus aquistagni]SMG48023.1 pyrophosphatase PpaX [Paenibacillus aquistagni]